MLVGLVIVAVYAPVAVELFRDWGRDANYSHGYLVPVVSLVLLWWRRRELLALPARPSWAGLVGVAGACGLLVLGQAGAEVFTQRVSLVVLLASVVLTFGGWTWLRRTLFPIAFLLLAIPLPYVVYYGLTGPMQGVAARVAIVGLRGMGIPAISEGNIIHLPETSLEVVEACSGIRSLYAFLALGALFARAMPIPGWMRVVLFLFTIPLSVVGNAIRVWGTGLGAHLFGPQVAEGAVHEFFGLIIFALSLILLLVLGKGVRYLWRSESSL